MANWNNTNVDHSFLPYCGKNGNMSSDLTSGTFPIYYVLGTTFTSTITNGGVGNGYVASTGTLSNTSTCYLNTTRNFTFTNSSTHTFEFEIDYAPNGSSNQHLCGEYSDNNNFWACRILGVTEQVDFIFRSGGTINRVVSDNVLTTGINTITYMKDGSTLRLFINGMEANYYIQNSYSLGTLSIAGTWKIMQDGRNSDYFVGDIFKFTVYDDVISLADVINNNNIGPDYGGFNGTDNGDGTMSIQQYLAIIRRRRSSNILSINYNGI